MDPDAIILEDATLDFDGDRGLDGMSFSVARGQMFGLVGPDGAGKTTAIRALLGILPLDSGRARVLGLDPVADAARVKEVTGYLAQRFSLYGDLTVQENLEFFGELHRVQGLGARIDELLAFTRLAEFRRRRADELSGGMQKKLALASTLVHTPEVLFLDEPTTGVDPVSRREFWTLLGEEVLGGLTVLVTTPYLDEAERCARVALVRDGKTLAQDTPEGLRSSYGGTVLEVVCTPAREARRLLEGNPRVRNVRLFGDRLHVTPARMDDDLADLLSRMPGVEVASARRIEPSLEDVFIARVEA
ncbi:MAG TPA: ABC transporter ATP-binding protein [Vulgatibacter sp.]